LDVASRIDLEDLTGTTGGGLHLATMGGLWQALVYGFAGVRPCGGRLVIAPHVPRRWPRLAVAVRFHGSRVRVSVEGDRLTVEADRPTPVEIADDELDVGPGAATFSVSTVGWDGAS
jgi:trehalose/maltose hydrolase-like predicted phosphorylase